MIRISTPVVVVAVVVVIIGVVVVVIDIVIGVSSIVVIVPTIGSPCHFALSFCMPLCTAIGTEIRCVCVCCAIALVDEILLCSAFFLSVTSSSTVVACQFT